MAFRNTGETNDCAQCSHGTLDSTFITVLPLFHLCFFLYQTVKHPQHLHNSSHKISTVETLPDVAQFRSRYIFQNSVQGKDLFQSFI